MNLVRDGETLAGPLDLAESFLDRTRGLLGRDGLPGRSGMVIEHCSSIHTVFMRFSIDVVFLSRDGNVLKVVDELAPWRAAWAWFAARAVELPAGLAREVGLCAGQKVELKEER